MHSSISTRAMVLAAMLLSLSSIAHSQTAARCEAVFADGTRVYGDKIFGWQKHPGAPRLDKTSLADAKRPLLWLSDRKPRRQNPRPGPAYIEFVGGDRIPGAIMSAESGDGLYVPAHLLVKPAVRLQHPPHEQARGVRILPDRITRVVFGRGSQRPLQPGALFNRGGRRLNFIRLRWQTDSVVLLTKGGARQVNLSDIAEIHLPKIDPWKAYYQELAVLSPACRSRMVHIETSDGLIATSSSLRTAAFAYMKTNLQQSAEANVILLKRELAGMEAKRKTNRQKLEMVLTNYRKQLSELGDEKKAAELKREFEKQTRQWEWFLRRIESLKSRLGSAPGAEGNADTWRHIVQPVWSLDPLWVQFSSIRMRWSFAPEQVPLCRIDPAAVVSPPLQPGQVRRSSADPPIRSGGHRCAWGFSVHARSELRFPLPRCAKAFRSRIGLDSSVASGGCARARVYVGSTDGKPAYESPMLIGSQKSFDSGPVGFEIPPEGPNLLVLQADPVNRGAPKDADPANIRDKLNWLDPRIELDKTALAQQVRMQVGPLLAGSGEWKLKLDQRGVCSWTSRFDRTARPGVGSFTTMLTAKAQPLKLLREMKVGPADKWLAVYLNLPAGENPPTDTIALLAGGRKIQSPEVPIRQQWRRQAAPIIFSLAEHKDAKATLELIQPAGGKPLTWRAVRILATRPPEYRFANIMKQLGKSDTQVSYGLYQALLSNRVAKAEKIAALEIHQFGGIVNFRPNPNVEDPADRLANVLVGGGWTGGDKALSTFNKMPSLQTLLVAENSGVSAGAIAKLQAQMPGLTITRLIKRTPSPKKNKRIQITWRNLTRRNVVVLWIDTEGKLRFSDYLKPAHVMTRPAHDGHRYETHYRRKDYASAEDYRFTQPLASFVAKSRAICDIKPWKK